MVEVERVGPVGRIFLNRPEKANALNSALLNELKTGIERLSTHEALRVVVLGGRGSTFCGGADVDELRGLNSQNAGAFVARIHHVCKAIRDLPVPVIARLHGAVIGAGLEIAAACDLRVAGMGLVEELAADVDLAVEKLVKSLLAGDCDALRVQKRLLQLWDEAPLAASVAQSIAAFSRTTISSTKGPKGH